MLGSSTRQVKVYGRRGRTRVVEESRTWDENTPQTPPRAPPAPLSSRGLFSTGTWGAWIASPQASLKAKLASPWKPNAPRDKEKREPLVICDPNAASSPTQPAVPSDTPADLSGAMATLRLDAPEAPAVDAATAQELPTTATLPPPASDADLAAVLRCVDQAEPRAFEDVVRELKAGAHLTKLGEASYSEVYLTVRNGQAPAVIKVLPLEMPGSLTPPSRVALSSMASVEREITVASALSRSSRPWSQHFVPLRRAYVVQGAYPATLLAAWDEYKAEAHHNSENARPDVFAADQLYALLVMDHAGAELEKTPALSWTARAAVFVQTACALAHAEKDAEFEVRAHPLMQHRDLHLGNILVRSAPRAAPADDAGPWAPYSATATGVHATIIDYSLSRIKVDGAVRFYDFSDEALFAGHGDPQYDVYRKMRKLVAGDWQDASPLTNVLVRVHPHCSGFSSCCSTCCAPSRRLRAATRTARTCCSSTPSSSRTTPQNTLSATHPSAACRHVQSAARSSAHRTHGRCCRTPARRPSSRRGRCSTRPPCMWRM